MGRAASCDRICGTLVRTTWSAVLVVGLAGPLAAEEVLQPTAPIKASLQETPAPGAGQIVVGLPAPLGRRILPVADEASRDKLAEARKGDIVRVRLDSAALPKAVAMIESVSRPIGGLPRLFTLALAFAMLAGIAAAVTGGRPQRFMIGIDGRYSNSQSQLVLWSATVAIVYLATLLLRVYYLGTDFIGGVGHQDRRPRRPHKGSADPVA